MNRPNFKDFRIQLAAYAASVGSPLGVCINNIPSLAGLVNVATEELISDPDAPEEGWWGGWAKFVFNISQSNPFLVYPRGVARAILLDVCSRPVKIQNGFYEFLDYGRGLEPKPCKNFVCNGITTTFDRDTVPTLGTLNSTPQFVRIFISDSRDVGKTVIVQGTDQNGQVVLGTDPISGQSILGEVVTLALPFAQTQHQFSNTVGQNNVGITGLQKDVTFGPLTFMQVDAATGTANSLSSMEPTETSAAYRRYLVNNVPCNCFGGAAGPVQVVAQCKLEYVPIASDSDYLGIPCVPALIAQCESIRYRAMDNVKAMQMGDKKHAEALQFLFGQLQHYLGNERPAISVSLFGPRRMLKHQPI